MSIFVGRVQEDLLGGLWLEEAWKEGKVWLHLGKLYNHSEMLLSEERNTFIQELLVPKVEEDVFIPIVNR